MTSPECLTKNRSHAEPGGAPVCNRLLTNGRAKPAVRANRREKFGLYRFNKYCSRLIGLERTQRTQELFLFALFVFFRGYSFNLPALKLELQQRAR
jgi:hypothetical protein